MTVVFASSLSCVWVQFRLDVARVGLAGDVVDRVTDQVDPLERERLAEPVNGDEQGPPERDRLHRPGRVEGLDQLGRG